MKYYKLDKDVKAYLKRMAVDGIKTPADIYTLNDFIVGLKDINLFNFVEMYFYSTLHNSSSGTNIYAFRDGKNNGTLINGGYRRDDGVKLLDYTNTITSNLLIPLAPCSLIWVANIFGSNSSNQGCLFSLGVNNNGAQFSLGTSADTTMYLDAYPGNWYNGSYTTATYNKKDNNFHFWSFSMISDFGPLKVYVDSQPENTTSTYLTTTSFNSIRGNYNPVAYANPNGPILHSALIYDRSLSALENTNLYSLIKATIGKTLKIP
jgi:hypothetical protein